MGGSKVGCPQMVVLQMGVLDLGRGAAPPPKKRQKKTGEGATLLALMGSVSRKQYTAAQTQSQAVVLGDFALQLRAK